MRRPAVVAVFGPSPHDGKKPPQEILDVAKAFGDLVTARGNVLLTGGTKRDEHSVKGMAIAGAGSHPWVGVLGERHRIS